MRHWFGSLGTAERAVVVLTLVAVIAAVALMLVPFETEGIACGTPLAEWLGQPRGSGGIAGFDAGVDRPCSAAGKRRVLVALLAAILAPFVGWVGVGVARHQTGQDV